MTEQPKDGSAIRSSEAELEDFIDPELLTRLRGVDDFPLLWERRSFSESVEFDELGTRLAP